MKKIVTIGGGTGSFTLLSGIKNIPDISISAIVAMTDDGGSTGTLRDELGVLPPGDIRQCLVALSPEDRVMRDLMSYRFENGGLVGHSFGNIFLAGLEKVTGSFVAGVEIAAKILKIKGNVLPVTAEKARLNIELDDGSILNGEDKINNFDVESVGIKRIYIEDASINPHAKKALLEADYIFVGPGNHLCSILPNLVVQGVQDAFQETKAKIIYIANLTNKRGHTSRYRLSDYVADIEKNIGKKLNHILVNGELPTKEQIEVYKIQEGENVLVENNMESDSRVLVRNILSTNILHEDKNDKLSSQRAFIRHDSEKLSESVRDIIS